MQTTDVHILQPNGAIVHQHLESTTAPIGGAAYLEDGGFISLIGTTLCGNGVDLEEQIYGGYQIDEESCIVAECTDNNDDGTPDGRQVCAGIRAWIEDVIVDDAARGKGVGRLLNEAAIAHAFDEGAITVDLTSRPSREAANRLYQRIGFVQRETNVYRYSKPDQLES